MTRLERIEKLAVIASSAITVVGVIFGVWQLRELVEQNEHEKSSKSAELMLQLVDRIEDKFNDIEDEIDNNDHNHPLVKREGKDEGHFRAWEVERYINQFDDVGVLLEDKLILPDMAYSDFSYDVEKAWCNVDVQKIISSERATAAQQATSTDDGLHVSFEKLAKGFLSDDKFTCVDVDKE